MLTLFSSTHVISLINILRACHFVQEQHNVSLCQILYNSLRLKESQKSCCELTHIMSFLEALPRLVVFGILISWENVTFWHAIKFFKKMKGRFFCNVFNVELLTFVCVCVCVSVSQVFCFSISTFWYVCIYVILYTYNYKKKKYML